MCGIIGYVGHRDVGAELISGLSRLEYRGYDSAGVVLATPDRPLELLRTTGRVEALSTLVKGASSSPLSVGLGHTRWATHGAPEERNAHPHLSPSGRIALVHNGIIENYAELRRELEELGHRFSSDTDSEVIAHLIERHDTGDLLDAVRQTILRLRGSWALGVVRAGHPEGQLVGARSGSPLVIGRGERENYLASDVSAFIGRTRQCIFLEEGDVTLIEREAVQIWDADGVPRLREAVTVSWSADAAERGGYEHFMRKEIDEQPRALRDALLGRVDPMVEPPLHLPQLDRLAPRLASIDRIFITACGTSFHAGLIAKRSIEGLARLPVELQVASEVDGDHPALGERTLLIAISQSGETADTLGAVRAARARGAAVLALCNVVGSTLARTADEVLQIQAGPEIGVASTKAFTTQVVVLQLVAAWLGRALGTLCDERLASTLADLREAPRLIEEALDSEPALIEAARVLLDARCVLFLGRGGQVPIALEGALKLEEVSYIPCLGLGAGEMKHGPIALVDPKVPSVFLMPDGDDAHRRERLLSNLQEVKARRGPVIALGGAGDPRITAAADVTVPLPLAPPLVAPLVSAVAVQLLAYHAARLLGRDVDRPRNLAKSVTVV